MAKQEYLHGYTPEEQQRLRDQNAILAKHIYKNIELSTSTRLLEVGCGVGAQLEYVMTHYPSIKVTGVDISDAQIEQAKINLKRPEFKERCQLYAGDITSMKLGHTYDSLLLVWVLEHVKDPISLLTHSLSYIESGGRFSLTEVNNQSLKITGVDSSVMEVWNAMHEYQSSLGGNGNIGAELKTILGNITNVKNYAVDHRLLYWNGKFMEQRNEMMIYWIGLMKSSAITMIDAGVIKPELWEAAQHTMREATTKPDSSFSYAFVQASGVVN